MTTVDQFLKALAVVESSDNPIRMHLPPAHRTPAVAPRLRLWHEMQHGLIFPKLGETWDQLVARVLRTICEFYLPKVTPVEIAMYWHIGHWIGTLDSSWDRKYEAKFQAALLNAQEEMP